MPDALKKVFQDNLYPKSKERNWERTADRYGDELCQEISDMFPHADMALCAVIHAMASLVMQAKKDKRGQVVSCIVDAVKDRIVMFEDEEEDNGPGDSDEDENLENEDDVDFESTPERPSPEPTDDNDDGLDHDDPNESTFNDNKPANVAGYRPPKRRPGGPK